MGQGRLTQILATPKPENLLLEVWSQMGTAVQKKNKQEWSNERSKFDDARRLRSINFIGPEDGEYEVTIKNTRYFGSSNGGGDVLQKKNKKAFRASGS